MAEPPTIHETRFTMDTSAIKFGPGATREVGADMARLGGRRVMVVTDPRLAAGETVATVLDALRREGIDAVLYDRVRVEPTDATFMDAAVFAADGKFDGYVAVGGGSVMDTAKAANLYATYPAPFLTYVNPPIGEGKPVPGPLKPLIAIPTTAGTGSETTGVAIFDYEEMHAKTGIAHRASATGPGHRRPRQHPHHAADGRRLLGAGCPLPRGRVVHRAAIQRTAGARSSGTAARLPGS